MKTRHKNYIVILLIATITFGVTFYLEKQSMAVLKGAFDTLLVIKEGIFLVVFRAFKILMGMFFMFLGYSFMFRDSRKPDTFLLFGENNQSQIVVFRGVLMGFFLSFGFILLEDTISYLAFEFVKFIHKF
jgi:hypothetical protein